MPEELNETWNRTLASDFDWNAPPTGATLRPCAGTDSKPRIEDARPSRFDGYRFGEEIARGGVACILGAEQASLRRAVAVKTFDSALPVSPQEHEHFVAEALVTGYLDHPNIVPVYDLGTTEDGRPFLAMKRVGGESWRARLGARPENRLHESFEEQIEILLAVCNAVAFAHSRGVIHRDLKPDNVMVGSFGEVLVMDWGGAVDVGGSSPAPSRDDALPTGTPSYMAPEIAEARHGDLSEQTDVFLLGAILHELLTGSPPHRGPTIAMVFHAAAKNAPREYGDEVPPEAASIARRAMATDPADRFESVKAFQTALRDLLEHRESTRLSDAARGRLETARAKAAAGSHGESGSRDSFEDFNAAIAAFDQALEMWSGNGAAAAGLRETRVEFASAALATGNLGLARAQLDAVDADTESLSRELDEAVAQRDRTERASRRARRTITVAVVAVILALAAGITLSEKSRRAEERAKEQAVTEKENADRARDAATAAAEKERLANAEARFEAGKRAAQRGRWEEAQVFYAQALEAGHPDVIDIEIAKVEAYNGMASNVAAVETLEGLDPDASPEHRAKILLLQGMLGHDRLTDPDAGLPQIREALDMEGGLAEAERHLAESFFAESIPAARASLEASLAADPSYLFSNELYLNLLLLTLDIDRAVRFSEDLRKIFPDYELPVAILTAAQASYEGKKNDAAKILGETEFRDDATATVFKLLMFTASLFRQVPETTLKQAYMSRYEQTKAAAAIMKDMMAVIKLFQKDLADAMSDARKDIGVVYNIPPVAVRLIDAKFKASGLGDGLAVLAGKKINLMKTLEVVRTLKKLPHDELDALYAINPEDAIYSHTSGLSFMERGEFAVAAERFEVAANHAREAWLERLCLTMAATNAFHWGSTCAKNGDEAEMKRAAEASLPLLRRQLDRNDLVPIDFQALVLAYRTLGRHELEAEAADRYFAKFPDDWTSAWTVARVSDRLERWPAAFAAARRTLELNPEKKEAAAVLERAKAGLRMMLGDD